MSEFVKDLNQVEFEEFIKEGNVIVEFYADWCSPCKMLAPIFEKLAEKFETVKFGKINAEKEFFVSKNYGIQTLPCLIFFSDGKEVSRIVGPAGEFFIEEKLRNFASVVEEKEILVEDKNKIYDLIIVGAGPAGLSAAVYASRYKLDVLVVGELSGGLISEAYEVCNFPSYDKIEGLKLGQKLVSQVQNAGVEIKKENVLEILKKKNFEVKTEFGSYVSKKIILAVGTERRKLGVLGEKNFYGKGVSYCATCDAGLYKDSVVAVVGGGNSALTASLILSKYAKKVYVVCRGQSFTAEPAWVDIVEKNEKIETIFDSKILEISGEENVNGILLEDGSELTVDGVFVQIGSVPEEKFSNQLGLNIERGYIVVNKKQQTSVDGVYAAGDITNNILKQAVTACGEGAIAAYSVFSEIGKEKDSLDEIETEDFGESISDILESASVPCKVENVVEKGGESGEIFRTIEKRVREIGEIMNLSEEEIDVLLSHKRVRKSEICVGNESYDAWRIVHNDSVGVAKGGVRYHPAVCEDEIKSLSFWMSLKNSLMGIPYGGAKGGVSVDPKKIDKPTLEKISRGFVREFHDVLGKEIDVPAPDVYTNPEVMGWMLDEFEKIKGKHEAGMITGKPLSLQGLKLREDATAQGGFIILNELVRKIGKESLRICVQGFGNAGMNIAKMLHKQGHKIIAVSDSRGGVFDFNGLNVSRVVDAKENGEMDNLELKKISNAELLELDCDVLVLAAVENQVTSANADKIKAKCILELANGPVDSDGDEILNKKNVLIIPDILANAGGVVASYFEWAQNLCGNIFEDDYLKMRFERMMISRFNEVYEVAREKDLDLRKAAYVIAIQRILDAEKARGNLKS